MAVDLYVRAAEQGDPTGQYLLGLMYDKGHGVSRDEVLAHKWLQLRGVGNGALSRGATGLKLYAGSEH